MANAAVNRRLEPLEPLLRNLKETVTFLMDISVFQHTVFYLGSGLQLLHSRVKAILIHGTRVNHYLIFSQPSFATFDTWLQDSLQDHSLISCLERDPVRLKQFYHDWAFIQNEELYKAFIDCLCALATRNFDALIRIRVPPPKQTELGNISEKVTKLPSNGIPVIMESQISSSSSAKVIAQDMYDERSISIRSPKAHEVSITVTSARTDEKDDAVSTSSSVPEFSYQGSPVSYHLAKFGPQSSTMDSKDTIPVVIGASSSSVSFSKSPQTKSFLEYGFKVQPTALGSFPLPQKGQSVSSFLTSLSDAAMPELDRENAHFNVSEALISAFESVKVKQWNEEIKRRQRADRVRNMFGEVASSSSSMSIPTPKKPIRRINKLPLYSETESDMDSAFKPRLPRAPLIKKKPRKVNKLDSEGQTESFLSTDASPLSTSSSEEMASSVSAEGIAMNLLRSAKVKEDHLADASELMWLVTEQDAPQALLPMPKTWNSTSESDTDSLDKSMRLRGTSDWAPPRPQIIFTEHPPPNLQNLLRKSRNLRCAGCGMRVDPKYASTFRYCHYLGRYFCTGCHSLKKARLPQRILNKWDFSPYHVSNFSYQLLESLQSDPVYNVLAINPNLYNQKRLQNFKNLRLQLYFLLEYLRNCKTGTRLYDEFNKLPTYYTADVDLYSLEDLLNLRFGVGLPLKVKLLVTDGINHVLKCQLCRQLGFHCEVCKRNDILFPFQIGRVSRCRNCSACFHSRCFRPGVSDCPKCLRLNRRRSTQNLAEDVSGAVLA